MKLTDLLNTDTSDLLLGSVVVPKDELGTLRVAAALAPTENAVEFFVKLRLGLGEERAKRVVNYLMDHADVLSARGGDGWSKYPPVRTRLKLVVDDNPLYRKGSSVEHEHDFHQARDKRERQEDPHRSNVHVERR